MLLTHVVMFLFSLYLIDKKWGTVLGSNWWEDTWGRRCVKTWQRHQFISSKWRESWKKCLRLSCKIFFFFFFLCLDFNSLGLVAVVLSKMINFLWHSVTLCERKKLHCFHLEGRFVLFIFFFNEKNLKKLISLSPSLSLFV